MRAVLPVGQGSSDGVPTLGELPRPVPGPGEILIQVHAAGLNRADLMQLSGHYPPPAGESPVPGLECSGVVVDVAPEVSSFRRGDRVMALLAGGGQAELAAVPAGQALALPSNLNFVAGAALPEALLTAWTNLVAEGGLIAGERVLVTGANGGMGTMAVALAAALGAQVIAVGRDAARLEPLRALGAAEIAVADDSLAATVAAWSGGRGVDLALDFVGGEQFANVLACLGPRGRLILIGLLAGPRSPLDLAAVLRKRLRITGSLLRPRPRAEKAQLVAAAGAFALPLLESGRLSAVVDRVFPFEQVADAYRALAAGGVNGKIVLAMPA